MKCHGVKEKQKRSKREAKATKAWDNALLGAMLCSGQCSAQCVRAYILLLSSRMLISDIVLLLLPLPQVPLREFRPVRGRRVLAPGGEDERSPEGTLRAQDGAVDV
jgi:hypothetical protein